MLSVQFLFGDIELMPLQQKSIPVGISRVTVPVKHINFSLDQLNEFQTAKLTVEGQFLEVYVSTYRDTELKVIEFSDTPSNNVVDSFIEGIEESKESNRRGVVLSGQNKKSLTLEID